MNVTIQELAIVYQNANGDSTSVSAMYVQLIHEYTGGTGPILQLLMQTLFHTYRHSC